MRYLAMLAVLAMVSAYAATYHYELKNGSLNKIQPFAGSNETRELEQYLEWNSSADVEIRSEGNIFELACIDDLSKKYVAERFIVRTREPFTVRQTIVSPHGYKMAIQGLGGCLVLKWGGAGQPHTLHLLPLQPAETAVWSQIDRTGDDPERYLYTSECERYDFITGKVTRFPKPPFPKGLTVRTTGMMYLPEDGGRLLLKVVIDEFEGYGINRTYLFSLRTKRWTVL